MRFVAGSVTLYYSGLQEQSARELLLLPFSELAGPGGSGRKTTSRLILEAWSKLPMVKCYGPKKFKTTNNFYGNNFYEFGNFFIQANAL